MACAQKLSRANDFCAVRKYGIVDEQNALENQRVKMTNVGKCKSGEHRKLNKCEKQYREVRNLEILCHLQFTKYPHFPSSSYGAKN